MPIAKSFLLAGLLMAGNAVAASTEYCPSVPDIRHTQGIYTADTVSGKHQWLGVVQDSKPGAVALFEGALFYPDSDEGTRGVLSRCNYRTAVDSQVALRYRVDSVPDVRVDLENLQNWKKRSGPFGIIYFECTSQAAGACAFRESES